MTADRRISETPVVLGIETSCDETAAAVVQGWRKILGNVVVSQEIHADWGGVVPELASREHLKLVLPSIRQAMSTAGVTWDDLDGIAVTRGPGLIGALLVGVSTAKALALGTGLPLIGVNHLEGHLFSLLLEDPEWRPPYLVLIASGGHTEIHMVEDLGVYRRLGSTVDDAAGEAFDKIGVLLGLDYPAGARLDSLAGEAGLGTLRFPVARVDGPGHNFSFSGVKTAVMNHWRNLSEEERGSQRGQVASAFQLAVVQALVEGMSAALDETGAPRFGVTGGVASNRELRRQLTDLARRRGIDVAFPGPRLCTDNAAMIAAAGAFHLTYGQRDGFDMDADPSLRLPSESYQATIEDTPGGKV
ncbi:tRNA (adenosine(37)-N6)-threonylcarbamoyltransferase complex transferase subunit TsaD [Gemmatimonadota bacterium]